MEALIQQYLETKLKGPYAEQLRYAFGKGKRVRPKILQMVCSKYKVDFKPLVTGAIAVELMHCTSLLHDDIIDEELSRRGNEPFYRKYGLSSALLFGDLFAAISMEIFSDNYPKDLYLEFIKTFKTLIEGQLMELDGSIVDYNNYLKYVEKKTASLFLLAAKVPYLYYNLKDEKILESGREFGFLFQIADDLSSKKEERYSVLKFISRKEATAICKEKIAKIKKLAVFDMDKLPLNLKIV